jgi:hypothetical protein
VLVGGDFTSVGGVARQRAAALSKTTGAALPWAPAFDAPVNCLAYGTNQIYVGGSFTNVNTTNLVRGLAALDPVTGDPTSFNFEGTNGSSAVSINALVIASNALYAGGAFTGVANQSRRHLVALDQATGAPISGFNARLGGGSGGINSLVLAGTNLYACGDFTTVNAVSMPRLAVFSPVTGASGGWTPSPNRVVTVLTASPDTLYAGGEFTTISGIALRNFAAYNLADNSLLPIDAQLPSATDGMTAISATPTALYVAGWFSAIGGEFRLNLGCLASSAVAYEWNPSPDVPPTVVTLTDDLIFIGGGFRFLGQSPTSQLTGFLAAFPRAPQITTSSLVGGNIRIVTTTGDLTDVVIQATPDLAHPTWTDVATNGTPGFSWTNEVPTVSPNQRFFRTVAR